MVHQILIVRRVFFLLSFLFLFYSSSLIAQEKPDPDKTPASSSARTSVAAKKQSGSSNSQDADTDANENPQLDKDGPDQIKKRDEWFYKQRSSVNGRIPSGAHFKAFQHMQRMMLAEGKLSVQPDGSYKEVAPQAFTSPPGSVTTSWTSIGPTPTTGGFFSPVTGRITTIAVDPSDATGNTVLIGGADGGIWRTTDGGSSWTPVGDQNPSLAMGSIAFAPSNPKIVYAATGEQASIGFDVYYGAGVLKSPDNGQTWTPTCTTAGPSCPFIGPYLEGLNPGFGFFNFGGAHISYVAVNPSNPSMILVAAQFVLEGPQEGVYCSDNAGATWSNILPDEMSTFVGFASSTVAYAALGNPFGSSSHAPHGNGIYRAASIGSLCNTIQFTRSTAATLPPQGSLGRIDLGIAASDASGKTVYASIADANTGSNTNLGVFVTTDGGTSWTQTSAPDICQHQCWYDNVIKVDPTTAGTVFIGGSSVSNSTSNDWVMRSTASGGAFSSVLPSTRGAGLPHVDVHAITLFKATSGAFAGKVRVYLGNDGGIWRSDDAEAPTITWTNINNASLTLTQFYPSISINASSPAIAFGGTQDNASQNYSGSLNWVDNNLCGDGASSAVDFIVPSTVYIGCATGFPVNVSYQNGAVGTFSPAIDGINLSDTADFIPPLAADPTTPNVVYFGTTKIYQSLDAGNSWAPISNDIALGGNGDWLTAIAIEPGNPSVIYAGLNNGQVFFSNNVTIGQNSIATFTAVNAGLPPRTVTAIAADPSDPTGLTACAAFSGFSFVGTDILGHSVNDSSGHIFKTTNNGNLWTDVSCSVPNCTNLAGTDLPNIPVNDIVIDPDLPGILYAATDLGVFVGNCTTSPCSWNTLGTGLPHVAVLSLRLHEPSRTLRAATHGRGVWDINLNNFSFTGPHISSISPTSSNVGVSSALTLTVNGSGLAGGTVQWNGTAIITTQVSATQLTASVAASLLSTAGTPQISVKNGAQTSNLITFSVLAGSPTLSSLSPSTTPVQTPTPSTNVPIQVNGTNFSSNAKVLFNGAQNGIATTFKSSTSLTATLPAALLGPFGSTNDISVLDPPPGGGKSQAFAFTVASHPPINDNFAAAITISTVSFTDIQDSSGATTQSTDPVPPCSTQYTSAQGNTGGHSNGQYHTLWYQFTPTFASNLEVDTIGSSYDTVLSIWTGAPGNFVNVACNDDIVSGVNIQSQISGLALTAGTTYYIMVSSFGPPDGNSIALGGKSVFNFTFNSGLYPAPTLSSLSQTTANSGDPSFTLTLTGTNFFSGAILQFVNSATFFGNGIPATFVSPTSLTAVIPASVIALPGSFLISVNNPTPNFGSSNALPFIVNLGKYPVPTLTSIFPTTVVAGSLPFTINATGAEFAPGAVLNFNGTAKATTLNGTQNLFAPISTADISTPGTVPVTVSNPSPGGGPSVPPLSFAITAPTQTPTITSVGPTTILAGTPVNFTINGTNFTQGAIAVLPALGAFGFFNLNFVSSTQLTAVNVTFSQSGTFPMYIVDPPPAGTSAPFNLVVTQPPPPTITSITPSSAALGTTANLTITGTGFQLGAEVFFNGANFSTNVSSPTQLTVSLPLFGIAAGTYPIVVNVQGAGPSAPFNFTVTGPPDFTITAAGTTSQTVSAGQTANFSNAISIAPVSGFSSTVNLSCSSPASATTCTVNPTSFATGSGAASVMVTTTARGTTLPLWFRLRPLFRPQFVPVVLLLLLLSILLLRYARTRSQRFVGALPLAGLVLFLLLQSIGCGGGGYSQPPPQTGTAAGSYTITVTATATTNTGTLTHTTTLTLVVQ
jgi:hypothetical protein